MKVYVLFIAICIVLQNVLCCPAYKENTSDSNQTPASTSKVSSNSESLPKTTTTSLGSTSKVSTNSESLPKTSATSLGSTSKSSTNSRFGNYYSILP